MGAAGQLKQLYLQMVGGQAPSGAADANGDMAQMIKYIRDHPGGGMRYTGAGPVVYPTTVGTGTSVTSDAAANTWGAWANALGSVTPTVASVTQTASIASGTNHNVSMPATVAAGDLLMLWIRTGTASNTATAPSGWTQIQSTQTGTAGPANYIRLSAYYKVAAGTEGGTTVNVTTDVATTGDAQVVRILAANFTGVPQSTTPATQTTGTTPNPPAVTSSYGIETYLAFAITLCRAGTSTVTAYPAGYADNNTTTSSTLAMASTVVTAVASADPGTFTISANDYAVSMTILVRAAPNLVSNAWYLQGFGLTPNTSASLTYGRIQVATGSIDSPTTVLTDQTPVNRGTAPWGQFRWSMGYPILVAANANVYVRMADNVASALAHNITFHGVATSDVVSI